MADWWELTLTATARTPVSLPTEPMAGNEVGSGVRVQGRTVRGALAANWLQLKGCWSPDRQLSDSDHQEFVQVFESGAVRFGPLLPTPGEVYVGPVPASAQTCKLTGGFHLPLANDADTANAASYQPGHGVWDGLLPTTAGHSRQCNRCGGVLQSFEGSAGLVGLTWQNGRGQEHPLPTELFSATHTAVRNGTAAEGLLYTDKHLPAGTVFEGSLQVSEESLLRLLVNLLTDCGHQIRVGRRSASMGLLDIAHCEVHRTGERYATTHGPLRERLAAYHDRTGQTCFSLLCVTPLILLDPWLRPLRLVPPAVLAERLGCEVAWAGERPIWHGGLANLHGWQAAHGLPRSVDVGMAAGAVGLYTADASVDDLVDALAELEWDGLGERRAEGFGQVLCADPWHLTGAGGEVQVTQAEGRTAPKRKKASAASSSRLDAADWLDQATDGDKHQNLFQHCSQAQFQNIARAVREAANPEQVAAYFKHELGRNTLGSREKALVQALEVKLDACAEAAKERKRSGLMLFQEFVEELSARKQMERDRQRVKLQVKEKAR